jgi:hypothetical protein
MTVTTANIANAVGVSLGSMLFARFLERSGVAVAANYQEWSRAPAPYLSAFRHSWLIVAGFGLLAFLVTAVGRQPSRSETAKSARRNDRSEEAAE